MDGHLISHNDWHTIQKKLRILDALEDAGVSDWEHYPKGLLEERDEDFIHKTDK